MFFVIRVLVTALALWLTSLIMSNRVIIFDDGTSLGTLLAVLVLALIFNVVHSIVKPFVRIVALPLYILTLGLFSLVVNALMLWLVTWVTGPDGWFSGTVWGLRINGGFWWYVLAALVISLLQVVIGALAPKRRSRVELIRA